MAEPVFIKCEPEFVTDLQQSPIIEDEDKEELPFQNVDVGKFESNDGFPEENAEDFKEERDTEGSCEKVKTWVSGSPTEGIESWIPSAACSSPVINSEGGSTSQQQPKDAEYKYSLSQDRLTMLFSSNLEMRENSNLDPTCRFCGRTFSSIGNKNAHEKLHTCDRPFMCMICGMAFNKKGTLAGHQIIHSGYKPFKCELCPMTFARKSGLKTHMITHTNEKQFVCDICNGAFSRKTSLREHMLIHQNQKLYSCTVCNRAFTKKSTMKNHLLVHSQDKFYFCTVCKKGFARLHTLQCHMSVHEDVKPYKCHLCDSTFAYRSSLTHHLAIHKKKGTSIPQVEIS